MSDESTIYQQLLFQFGKFPNRKISSNYKLHFFFNLNQRPTTARILVTRVPHSYFSMSSQNLYAPSVHWKYKGMFSSKQLFPWYNMQSPVNWQLPFASSPVPRLNGENKGIIKQVNKADILVSTNLKPKIPKELRCICASCSQKYIKEYSWCII